MKKRDAVQKLKVILNDWDACMIDTEAAEKILARIEKEIGVVPRDRKRPSRCTACDSFSNHTWEPTK